MSFDRKQALFAIGRPFSPLYAALMRLRARAYEYGIFKQHRLSVPVVSVGNLTLGGTGKTPIVQYIASQLQGKGYHPAIISRGYGGKARQPINIVSDHKQIYLDAYTAGDEPRLLAENLPGIPVLTGEVRKLPARRAVQMGADLLILDDGFQHLAIHRDLDLVLFNGDYLAGNSRIFPGGDLREPVTALQRCHGFILTAITAANRERASRFAELLTSRFPNRPVFFADYSPSHLISRQPDGTETEEQHQTVSTLPLLAFCGIARPQAFWDTLSRIDIHPRATETFKDHHRYTEHDIARLAAAAKRVEARALITTEKDFVKLRHHQLDLPLICLTMTASLDREFKKFVLNFLPT